MSMDVSRLRLNGFASGMDIDNMVSQLMQARRIPLDKLQQKKQLLEWKTEDYRTIHSKVLELRNLSFDMKLEGTYQSKKASVTNEDIVSVTATNGATAGNYTFKVTNMAKAAAVNSTPLGVSDSSATLEDLGMTDATATLIVGGEKGTVSIEVEKTDTLELLTRKINAKSTVTGVKMSYDATLDTLFATSTNTGSRASVKLSSTHPDLLETYLNFSTDPAAQNAETVTAGRVYNDGEETVIDSTLADEQLLRIGYAGNTYEMMVYADTTVEEFIKNINSSELGQTGVTAYLDETSKKIVFYNPDETETLTFTDGTADGEDILTTMGLNPGDLSTSAPIPVQELADPVNGENAAVSFNGVPGSYSSNTFTINGIQFTVKDKQALADDPVTVTVSQDVDAVFDKIKSFVDKYNETIAYINAELEESKYRDYQPLTDAQKEELSDDEVEKWETKARSGLLRRDDILTSSLLKFRTALYQVVDNLPEGDIKQLTEIGITTGEYSEKGKLYIDESALKEAIANNPEEVMALFTSDDGDDESTGGDGIANRLHQMADITLERIVARAGSASTSVLASYTIGKDISRIDKEIERWEERLQDLEDRYYKQFTAMETALNQMNAQSSYLMQQFGGGQ